jgi:hypothetical protein
MSNLLLPLAIDYWDSPSYAGFPCGNSLISDSCLSRPLSCHRLPSDSTSQWTPLPRLAIPTDTVRSGLSPPKNTPCLATRRTTGSLQSNPPQTMTGFFRVYSFRLYPADIRNNVTIRVGMLFLFL